MVQAFMANSIPIFIASRSSSDHQALDPGGRGPPLQDIYPEKQTYKSIVACFQGNDKRWEIGHQMSWMVCWAKPDLFDVSVLCGQPSSP